MAAILPSNGGNSEGLGDIEEKLSQEDFRVSLVSLVSSVSLVSLVFRVTQHSKFITQHLFAISYQL